MTISYDRWMGPREYQEFTVTIAVPGVFTKLDHGLSWKDQVIFSTTGALPTGISADTWYYVIPLTDDTFEVASTSTGTAITTTGTQSGTHSFASDTHKKMTMKSIQYR